MDISSIGPVGAVGEVLITRELRPQLNKLAKKEDHLRLFSCGFAHLVGEHLSGIYLIRFFRFIPLCMCACPRQSEAEGRAAWPHHKHGGPDFSGGACSVTWQDDSLMASWGCEAFLS